VNGSGAPLFVPALFVKVLLAVLVCVLGGFLAVYALLGPLPMRDIVGTLVCAPLVAYLIHLWVAPLHDTNAADE
jgi:hypothetical protein